MTCLHKLDTQLYQAIQHVAHIYTPLELPKEVFCQN